MEQSIASAVATFVEEIIQGEGPLYGLPPAEALAKACTWSTPRLAKEYSTWQALDAEIRGDFAEGERAYWKTINDRTAEANAHGNAPSQDPTAEAIVAGGKKWETWRNRATLSRYAARNAQEVACNVAAIAVGMGRELERRYAAGQDPRPADQVKLLNAAGEAEAEALALEKTSGELQLQYRLASALTRPGLELAIVKANAAAEEARRRRAKALEDARRFSWVEV